MLPKYLPTALYFNCQDGVPIRNCLEYLGHKQPEEGTPIQTDNTTAVGLAHDPLKQKRSKAFDMRFFWVRDRQQQKQYNVYWKPGRYNKSDYYTKHHLVAHHRNVRPYYLFDPQQPEKYYSTQVNYYAPLDDSDDDTVDTVPTTDSESDTDYSSDEETIVASNCSRQSSATGGVGEGVLKSQSHVTHITGLSSLASSATPSGHNIS